MIMMCTGTINNPTREINSRERERERVNGVLNTEEVVGE